MRDICTCMLEFKDKKMDWKEYSREYRKKTKIIKKMPVDELLEHVGYPTTTRNKLFEEAAEVNNPELDKMIINQHIRAEA